MCKSKSRNGGIIQTNRPNAQWGFLFRNEILQIQQVPGHSPKAIPLWYRWSNQKRLSKLNRHPADLKADECNRQGNQLYQGVQEWTQISKIEIYSCLKELS